MTTTPFNYVPGQHYDRAYLKSHNLWPSYMAAKKAWAQREFGHEQSERAKDENSWYFWRGDVVGKVGNVATLIPVVGQAYQLASNLAEMKTGGKVGLADWINVIPMDIGAAGKLTMGGMKLGGKILAKVGAEEAAHGVERAVVFSGEKIFTTATKHAAAGAAARAATAEATRGMGLKQKILHHATTFVAEKIKNAPQLAKGMLKQGAVHLAVGMAMHTALYAVPGVIDGFNEGFQDQTSGYAKSASLRAGARPAMSNSSHAEFAKSNPGAKTNIGRAEPYHRLAKRLGAERHEYRDVDATTLSTDGKTLIVPKPENISKKWRPVHDEFVRRVKNASQLQGAGKRKLLHEIERDLGIHIPQALSAPHGAGHGAKL